MKIDVRKKGKICIVDISGEIKIGPATTQLRDKSKELLGSGERTFVYNMSRVPWVDSSGVGEVVACRNRVVDRDGQIKVVLEGKAHDIFVKSELQKVMEIYEDLEEALASFAQ